MRTKYKPWAVEYLKSHFDNQFNLEEENIDALVNFVSSKDTYLEIGPGKGQFILNIASRFLNYNFLVCELNKTISGICLKKIDESNLNNVKLISCDFYKLREFLKKVEFCGLFLNFSDPWPKKRHTNRRLTSPNFLVEYSKILKNDHSIYFKTDNDKFYEYSKEMFELYNWRFDYKNENYLELDDFDAETEFESKFKNEGIKIKRLILTKTNDTIEKAIEEEDKR